MGDLPADNLIGTFYYRVHRSITGLLLLSTCYAQARRSIALHDKFTSRRLLTLPGL